MEELNVLYTINQKYVDICLTSLLSIIKNSGIPYIHCHIITSGFQKEDYQKLNQFIAKHQNVEIKCYPLENFNIEQFNIPNWRGTQIPNARLFFQEIMNQEISKIKQLLYLDADTLTVSDLTKLKEFQNGLCAAKDIGITKKRCKELGVKNYYNAGVLLIDTDYWTTKNSQDKIIKFLMKNKKTLLWPDQDILNLTFQEEINSLPIEFNLSDASLIYNIISECLFLLGKNITTKEVIHAKNNPAIIHCCGFDPKPWNEGNLNPLHEMFMNLMQEVNPNFQELPLSDDLKRFSQNPQLFYDYYLKQCLIWHIPSPVRDRLIKIKNFTKTRKI